MGFSAESILLDRNSPIPLYYQVAQRLEQAIEAGELAPGAQLDNEIQLADRLGLSRPTMRRAIGYLADKGYVVRQRGIGTTVVRSRVRRPVALTSLYDDLASAGQRPRTRVLALGIVESPHEVSEALELPEGTPVLSMERQRLAADEPLAVLRNYLPVDLLEVTHEDLERTGLYARMREAGLRPHSATQTIAARAASAAEARLLGDRRGAPLLTMQRTSYDDRGRALEYGDHFYKASAYSVTVTLVGA